MRSSVQSRRSWAKRAASSAANGSLNSASASPRQSARASPSRRAAARGSPPASATRPASRSRSNRTRSMALGSATSAYPPGRVTSTPAGSTLRSWETCICTIFAAVPGTSSPQRSSMRRSAGTVRLASSASRASSARGLRPPSRTGADPSRTSNGPRRSVTMEMAGDATPPSARGQGGQPHLGPGASLWRRLPGDPVITSVLPASGASAATGGGRSSSRTSRSTPSSRSRTSSARAPSRLRCVRRLAATSGPMSPTWDGLQDR